MEVHLLIFPNSGAGVPYGIFVTLWGWHKGTSGLHPEAVASGSRWGGGVAHLHLLASIAPPFTSWLEKERRVLSWNTGVGGERALALHRLHQ